MPDARNTPTRRELIDRLAPLVWQERQQEAERCAAAHTASRPPWYFLNVNHPVIKRLYLRYLRHSLDGTALSSPPGDLDRVKFELALLHPAVLRQLAEEYEQENTDELYTDEHPRPLRPADPGGQKDAGDSQDTPQQRPGGS